MFDVTPNVTLSEDSRRPYNMLRFILYVVFLALAVLVALRVVFPNAYGFFDFSIYYGADNTIIEPRYSDGEISRGEISSTEPLIFNFTARGRFDEVKVVMKPENDEPIPRGDIEVIRSYRAALYPVGEREMFRDGLLLEYDDSLYVVSDGELRKFASDNVAFDMGYSLNDRRELTTAEYELQSQGDEITENMDFINGMIVSVDGEFFQYREDILHPFVSERAFLSQFDVGDAAKKNRTIFQDLDVNDIPLGFLSGTLLSHGESVYVVEGDVLRPVSSAETFLAKGYRWEDVVSATDEEFGMYLQGRLYTNLQPHPNGTLLHDIDTNSYYKVYEESLRPIVGDELIKTFTFIEPISIERKGDTITCVLEKKMWSSVCVTSFEPLADSYGEEYQFTYIPEKETHLATLEVEFIREKSIFSLAAFVREVQQRFSQRFNFI